MPTWFRMLLSIIAVLAIGAIGHTRQPPVIHDLAKEVLAPEPGPKRPRLAIRRVPFRSIYVKELVEEREKQMKKYYGLQKKPYKQHPPLVY